MVLNIFISLRRKNVLCVFMYRKYNNGKRVIRWDYMNAGAWRELPEHTFEFPRFSPDRAWALTENELKLSAWLVFSFNLVPKNDEFRAHQRRSSLEAFDFHRMNPQPKKMPHLISSSSHRQQKSARAFRIIKNETKSEKIYIFRAK
jgi:hypothetical protein